MSQIPESQHTTSAQIVRWYESKPQDHRPHMGASLIGHSCERYIWLTWRWALKPEFKGRILRLFSTGQREEPRLVEELRGIGATVWETDPDTGSQWRVSAVNGHFGGSLDGIAKGVPEAPKTPCVLEFKTHSNKSYNYLAKKKVQAAKPRHYDQMQVYMGLMDLERALYLAVNKDTDDVYSEWVHFDSDRFGTLMGRAERLVATSEPPLRISTDAEFFECKWCSMFKHCHGGQAAEANCRTCCYASPVENAAWYCDKHSKQLDDKAQRAGCDSHLLIPALVPFGDPKDGGSDWVAYKHKVTGDHFVNGPGNGRDYGPNFSSRELHMTNGSLIQDILKLKNEFPGSKVVTGTTHLPAHYDLATAFDDIATHPDDIPIKGDKPEDKKKKAAIAKSIKGLEALK